MNTEEIENRIEEIRRAGKDHETPHSLEKDLYTDFIKYVASEPTDSHLAKKARLVLSTADIDFPRHFG